MVTALYLIAPMHSCSGCAAVPPWLFGGRARLKQVKAGRMNDEEAEIVSGLVAGDRAILHPSDKVDDGVRVRERD